MSARTALPTLCLAAVLPLLAPPVARGQVPVERYDGVWISPDTGREFNNPTSAYLDSAILRRRNMDLFVNQALMNQMLMDALVNEQFRKIGAGIIDAGHATSAVPKWDGEAVDWLLKDDLEGADREAAARALRAGWAAYADLAHSRGADPGDAADVVALAAVIGYEHFRDAKTTRRQLTAVADEVRAGLLADPVYQGKGARGAAEMAAKWAFATLALERNAAEAKTGEEKQLVREAGGVLLGGLYPTPAEALEPVDDGFIDRGQRIVAEGKGTTTFRRVVDDLAIARELTDGEVFEIPYDNRPLFGDPEPGADLRPYEERLASAKEDRAKAVAAALAEFRAEAAKRKLPADDLAAGGAMATTLLWPIYAEKDAPLTAAQVESARALFAADVVAEAGLQRLDDAARQRLCDRWAFDALTAVGDAERAEQEAAAAAESLKSDDPMTRLVGLSQQSSADLSRDIARSTAARLLGDLFSPRPLEKVTLTADSFAVAP